MRFVSLTELRSASSDLWRDVADAREVVVTRRGRPIAVLAAVDGASLEATLRALRSARAADAVARLQRASVRRGGNTLPMDAVEAEIAAARGDRKR